MNGNVAILKPGLHWVLEAAFRTIPLKRINELIAVDLSARDAR